MTDRRSSARLRSGAGSSRIGSAGSVAATPPRSPAMNRIPSSLLATKVSNILIATLSLINSELGIAGYLLLVGHRFTSPREMDETA